MDGRQLTENMQVIINEQFDKILKVTIEDNIYLIAIRRDQVPQIQHVAVKNNCLFISFSINDGLIEDKFDYFSLNKKGEITSITIPQLDKITDETYRHILSERMNEFLKVVPKGDVDQTIIKHRQKRTIDATAKIIRKFAKMFTSLPEIEFNNTVAY